MRKDKIVKLFQWAKYMLICIRCCPMRMLLFEQIIELITLFI